MSQFGEQETEHQDRFAGHNCGGWPGLENLRDLRESVGGIDVHDDHAAFKQREHDDVGVDRDRYCQQHPVAGAQSSLIERRNHAIDVLVQFFESDGPPFFSDAGNQGRPGCCAMQGVFKQVMDIHIHNSFA